MLEKRQPYVLGEITDVMDSGELKVTLHSNNANNNNTKSESRFFLVEGSQKYEMGDRVLLNVEGEKARIARRIPKENFRRFIAYFQDSREGGYLLSVDKGREKKFNLGSTPAKLRHGDIVWVEFDRRNRARSRSHTQSVNVIQIFGNLDERHIFSKLAIHEHGLVTEFSEDAKLEARNALVAKVEREDLRSLCFVTIDPEDARDHDDAVFVERISNGFRLYVAIADVAAFVEQGGFVDLEARQRGNSVYFPDQVIPMLPEELSAEKCSLHEGGERPVLFVAMDVNEAGEKMSHRFGRAVIVSKRSLTYEQAQSINDGDHNDEDPVITGQVKELFEVYHCLARASVKRGALNLDLPEMEVKLTPDGRVDAIEERQRLDSHKLVEEAMILANVAAAQTLESQKVPLIYRVHDKPKPEKVAILRKISKLAGHNIRRSNELSVHAINSLLNSVAHQDDSATISMQVLRVMKQARYKPKNSSHFGLSLKRYAHFTSPIRRYADLAVHRALISACELGGDGHVYSVDELEQICDHISGTERLAIQAERDVINRYTAQFVSNFEGKEIEGRISGLSKSGLFVRLNDVNVDGFVPLRLVGSDHFYYDRTKDMIRGKRTGIVFKTGQKVLVKVFQTHPIAGTIDLTLLALEGRAIAQASAIPKKRNKRISKKRKAKK